MVDMILFPSDYYSVARVDPDLQKEYEAVRDTGLYDVVLFGYDQWFQEGRRVLGEVQKKRPRRVVQGTKDKDIDTYCFLGDYTGEFPGIEQTMKALYDLRNNYHSCFLRGNKENYQIDELGKTHPEWDDYPSTIGMLRYANKHLTKEDVEFFNSFPITMSIKNDGMPDIVICHGSPRKVNEKFASNEQSLNEVVSETNADYIICGHTHKKMEVKCGATYIWNPGSVGASIDIPYSYRFMVLHDNNGEWKPEFISLEADVDRIIHEMKNAGLYAIAPYWTHFTELMVSGTCGKYTHGSFLCGRTIFLRHVGGYCIF